MINKEKQAKAGINKEKQDEQQKRRYARIYKDKEG